VNKCISGVQHGHHIHLWLLAHLLWCIWSWCVPVVGWLTTAWWHVEKHDCRKTTRKSKWLSSSQPSVNKTASYLEALLT
jgi:hypothetical protein